MAFTVYAQFVVKTMHIIRSVILTNQSQRRESLVHVSQLPVLRLYSAAGRSLVTTHVSRAVSTVQTLLHPPGGIVITRACLSVGWFVRSFVVISRKLHEFESGGGQKCCTLTFLN